MNLIDHRILIPTSPERVWHFVGDLKRNTEWQTNCRTISMLTSTPKPQQGTRLRITPDRGREYVIEITAWYDRFGYEYIVVEGGPFRENKGTVRLQEVPEGTIVQWTFSYRPGLFGSGGARTQESIIIDSLRGLYKLITKSKEVETFQAKSLMRDDPGVEARATYRPRHPFGDTAEGSSVRNKSVPRQPTRPQPPVTLTEPPIKQDDTKPRPVVVTEASPPAVVIPPVPYTAVGPVVEPDFLIDDPDVPFADVPSERVTSFGSAPAAGTPIPALPPLLTPPPMTPIEMPVVKPLTEPEAPAVTLTPDSAPPIAEPPVKIADTQQHPAPEPVSDTSKMVRQDTAPVATPYPTPAEVMPAVKPPAAPRRDKLMDTARISVFELFGLPKPSETQEIAPLKVDADGNPLLAESTPPPVVAAAQPEPTPVEIPPVVVTAKAINEARRFGRRALMRRKIVKIRLAY